MHDRSDALPVMLAELRAQSAHGGEELMGRCRAVLDLHGLTQLPEATVTAHLEAINRHFSLHTLQDIWASLQSDGSEWAAQVSQQMAGHSPLMMGVTLEQILNTLVEHYEWTGLAERIDIRCFKSDPSIKSSLTFLRKTPWAREKVERLYVKLMRTKRPL